MRKLIVVALALALISPTLSCAAEKAKEEPKQEQAQAVKKPDAPAQAQVKEPTLQELQAQRTAIALRLEGAEVSKKAIERIILDGQVSLSKLDEMIQTKSPKKEEAKK